MKALIAGAVAALLQFAPIASPGDPRIQSVPYDPDQVVRVAVADGYATLIELSPDERVESVVVGNSDVWQVTTGRQGDRLVVKPLAGAVPTNMAVVTDVRRYVFALEPAGTVQGTSFVVHFAYPPTTTPARMTAPPPLPAVAEVLPGIYRFSGTRALWPLTMTDDGRRTSIEWRRGAPMPAIFSVDGHGREQLVNGRVVGDRYVVEGTAPRFVFRLDRSRAAATRSAVGSRR